MHSPFTEGVQAGQNFGVFVAVQTYTADQELLVNLAHHGAGNSGAFTGHPTALTWESLVLVPCSLRSDTVRGRNTPDPSTPHDIRPNPPTADLLDEGARLWVGRVTVGGSSGSSSCHMHFVCILY